MRPQPLIAVRDVEASSRWYQQLLGLQSDHGGTEYERLVDNGVLVLQLHSHFVMHHHGPLSDPLQPVGNGVLLWFEVDDVEMAIDRAARMQAEVLKPKHRNPPEGDGGRIIGKYGFAIRTDMSLCWPVPTGQRNDALS